MLVLADIHVDTSGVALREVERGNCGRGGAGSPPPLALRPRHLAHLRAAKAWLAAEHVDNQFAALAS